MTLRLEDRPGQPTGPARYFHIPPSPDDPSSHDPKWISGPPKPGSNPKQLQETERSECVTVPWTLEVVTGGHADAGTDSGISVAVEHTWQVRACEHTVCAQLTALRIAACVQRQLVSKLGHAKSNTVLVHAEFGQGVCTCSCMQLHMGSSPLVQKLSRQLRKIRCGANKECD